MAGRATYVDLIFTLLNTDLAWLVEGAPVDGIEAIYWYVRSDWSVFDGRPVDRWTAPISDGWHVEVSNDEWQEGSGGLFVEITPVVSGELVESDKWSGTLVCQPVKWQSFNRS